MVANWTAELRERDDLRVSVSDVTPERGADPDASVVVVTYGRHAEEVRPTFAELANQTVSSFEVLLIDGGTDWDVRELHDQYDFVTGYVEFAENYGVNVCRNVGAELARGDVLIFLDDDAVPAQDLVEQHLRAHREHDVVAVRGRIYPKTPNLYNRIAPRYDLGDEPIPSPIDAEANVSIDSDAFEAVSGWNEDIFGHEGVELTSRLLEHYAPEALLYYPDAVVYHDFADGFSTLLNKKTRHRYYRQELSRHHPDLFTLYRRHGFETGTKGRRGLPTPTKVVLFSLNKATDVLSQLWARVYSTDRPTK